MVHALTVPLTLYGMYGDMYVNLPAAMDANMRPFMCKSPGGGLAQCVQSIYSQVPC